MKYTLEGQETVKEFDEAGADGWYSFEMPDADVTISADFFDQMHTIALDTTGAKASAGETITISVTPEAAAEGYKITGLTIGVTREENDIINEIDASRNADGIWSWKIPAKYLYNNLQYDFDEIDYTFTFKPVLALKALTLKAGASTNGQITLDSSKADSGDTISFTVQPGNGYKIVNGSVEVSITSGAQTQVVKATGVGTKYTCKLPDNIAEGSTAEVRARFTPGVQQNAGSGAGGKSTISAGVSVAVGVVKNTVTAEVENATVKAKGLTVNAASETTGTVEALAGYSQGDIGIGGAVAVNVGKAKTHAVIYPTANLEFTGGELNAIASSKTAFATKGDARGKETSKSAGVGAGIAVQVTGIETVAEIKDGTPITITKDLSGMEISATSSDTQKVDAAAGSAGGISVTPVLSLLGTGTETRAKLGFGTKKITCAGDIKIAANSDISRTLTADAAAAGGSVAVGGSFSISVLKDVTNAKLSRSVNTKGLSVTTTARNRTSSSSKASASGAASSPSSNSGSSSSGSSDSGSSDPDGKSGADKQADGMLGGAGKLSSHVNTGGTDPSSMRGSTASRQGASTTEGSIDVAAAFTLNIHKIYAKAEIDPDLTVTAKGVDGDGGAVIVMALAKNEDTITANGSASNGKIGVGVAVAINIVTYENIAVIGDSSVTADKLVLIAGMIESDSGKGSGESSAPDKTYGWLTDLLHKAVADLAKDIADALGFWCERSEGHRRHGC